MFRLIETIEIDIFLRDFTFNRFVFYYYLFYIRCDLIGAKIRAREQVVPMHKNKNVINFFCETNKHLPNFTGNTKAINM